MVVGSLLGSSALGCSFSAGAAGSEATDAETVGAQAALVTIASIASTERSATEPVQRADVVARVVRANGGPLDEGALRLAGLGDDLPVLGTCAPMGSGSLGLAALAGHAGQTGSGSSGSSAWRSRSLELMDLGSVAMDIGDAFRASPVATVTLAPRHVPDPAGVLSGIVYNARVSTESASQLTPRAQVTVRALGGPGEADPVGFTATITVPRDVSDVRLGGQDPREFFAPAGSVELTWAPEPEDAASAGASTIGVDVKPKDLSQPTIRCTFADTGRAILPAAALVSDEGTLTVHRVHRERFRLETRSARTVREPREPREPHDGEGEIRFDSARAFPYLRKARSAP